jgi:hypothetical protein
MSSPKVEESLQFRVGNLSAEGVVLALPGGGEALDEPLAEPV